jgi:predicted branched-subunit amino acid permease
MPICLGYLSVSFAFGIFAVAQGLIVWEAILISMVNVTSAGQLAGVPLFISGAPFYEMAATQLVINLRYALMSISLSQKVDRTVRLPDRFVISFVNTDEVFAVASSQPGEVGRSYLYGLIIPPYVGWAFGTAIGALAGNILPEILVSALGIAIYGMFFSILLPAARDDRGVLFAELLAAAISCILFYVPIFSFVSQGFAIIIASVIASAVLAFLIPRRGTDEMREEVAK